VIALLKGKVYFNFPLIGILSMEISILERKVSGLGFVINSQQGNHRNG